MNQGLHRYVRMGNPDIKVAVVDGDALIDRLKDINKPRIGESVKYIGKDKEAEFGPFNAMPGDNDTLSDSMVGSIGRVTEYRGDLIEVYFSNGSFGEFYISELERVNDNERSY